MEISVRAVGTVQVIKLRGGLRLGPPVDEVRATVENLAREGANHLVLDLAEVPIVDSTGIGLLVRAQTSARRSGGAVKLAGVARMVAQTLKITGLLGVFEVFGDANQAAESFAQAAAGGS